MSPLRVPVALRLHPPLPPGGYRVMKLMPTVIVATDMAKSKRVPRRRSANPISGQGAISVVDSKCFLGEDNTESLMHDEFTAIYERDGDWHIAYCPEIPGANGQGRTKKEAREAYRRPSPSSWKTRKRTGCAVYRPNSSARPSRSRSAVRRTPVSRFNGTMKRN